uniref:Uncharacterized protein n=1 Tax=Oryza barthii TaxID=65489 RepID=A0A0D3FJ12_9ORYZ
MAAEVWKAQFGRLVEEDGDPRRWRAVNYLAEQSAAIKLSYAESDAQKAYALVDGCRGHLDAALLLLDHVGLPDVHGMINSERLAAVADLEAAIVAVQRSTEMATAARQDVSGAS